MNFLNKRLHILFFIVLASGMLQGQNNSQVVGITSSIGVQSIFPFNSGSYEYSFKSIGLFWKRPFRSNGQWTLSYQLEPSYYHAHHKLTNPWYKLNERDQLYSAKIPIFQAPKTIREYVLKFGFDIQYELAPKWHVNMLLSIGPTYSNTETERLAKGFAFSDAVVLGVIYKMSNFQINVLSGIRHVSNANLKQPNNGHNASLIECRIGYLLK